MEHSNAYNRGMLRILCYLATALMLAACVSPPKYPAAGIGLPRCGSLPNCVNSDSGQGSQAIEPLRATRSQWQGLQDWIGEQQDWSIVEDQGNFLQFTAVTPMMRFRDDIQLLFKPELEPIQLRSSSRLGISDMGTNRKRVELLRQQLREIR